jgi:hypothetical protein
MVSLNELFTFVLAMSKKYNIDTSHSEIHSMSVLKFADENIKSQVDLFPYLQNQLSVIYCSAILHDMCDKKYVKEDEAIVEIEEFLQDKLSTEEVYYTKRIIQTMSYSKVKECGYPLMGEYEMAYHIVREADLLSSYDFDRSMIYHINKGNNIDDAYYNALHLFHNRVFNYNTDKLLISEYSQQKSYHLSLNAIKQIKYWHNMMNKKF